jgi:tetratricopeptide (TPR) repeat protein
LRAAGASFESAQIENDLAMAYLGAGNIARARELADEAKHEFERAGDERYLSAVLDTEAQVHLAAGELEEAITQARRAIDLAHTSGNRAVELAAMLTEARAMRAAGDVAAAEERYAETAELARHSPMPARLREVLREWAGLRADSGDHRGAYELTNEALAVN